jgi:membrane associated rhomboid family serine protease
VGVPQTRRDPNFFAFIATGVILGFVIGSVVAVTGDEVSGYSTRTSVLFFGALGACVFGLLAAIIAVLLDRRR